MKGIAFKATYNDGGAAGGLIGYQGVCSKHVIYDNVAVRGMTNCCDSPCADCFENGTRHRGGEPWCYEQVMLDPKRAPKRRMFITGGIYHSDGKGKEGEPIPVESVKIGDIAILTTVLPEADNSERFIFGLFRIGEIDRTHRWGQMMFSDQTMDVVLPDEIAIRLKYWDYQAPNKDRSRFWGAQLIRYLTEERTRHLLSDVMALLADSDDRDRIFSALDGMVKPSAGINLPTRRHRPGHPNGGGGEGRAHRELKEFVAKHPEAVGLPRRAHPSVEYQFQSGDAVDIMFDLPDGSAAVVEIETVYPWPGAHQCIKYRSLLEAHRGEPISRGKVAAILVAYDFDDDTRKFAAAYGVDLVKLATPSGGDSR